MLTAVDVARDVEADSQRVGATFYKTIKISLGFDWFLTNEIKAENRFMKASHKS